MKRTHVFITVLIIMFMLPILVTATSTTDGKNSGVINNLTMFTSAEDATFAADKTQDLITTGIKTSTVTYDMTRNAGPGASAENVLGVKNAANAAIDNLLSLSITPATTDRVAGNHYFHALNFDPTGVRTAVDKGILQAGSSVPAYTFATDTIEGKIDLKVDQKTSEYTYTDLRTTGETKATVNSHERLQNDAGADELTVDTNTQALKITTSEADAFNTGNDAMGTLTATDEMADDASAQADYVPTVHKVDTYTAENTPMTTYTDTGTALADDTIEAGSNMEIISGTSTTDDALAVHQSLDTFAKNAAVYYFTFDAANQTLTGTYELDSRLISEYSVTPISTRSDLMGYESMSAANSAKNTVDISVDETTLSITLPTTTTGQGEDLDSNGTITNGLADELGIVILNIENTGAATSTISTTNHKVAAYTANDLVDVGLVVMNFA